MKINRALIEKYNKPVPRYTSYPPANFFTEKYSTKNYLEDIISSNDLEPNNISFYIHIPFCKKLCHYCGCNSCPMAKNNEVEAYMKALHKEIEHVTQYLDKSRRISQIHYGGGTPNAIPVSYLQKVNDTLFNKFNTIENPEIAIECHPAFLDKTYIEGLKEAGFNRISLGLQDFKPEVLKAVNREPSQLPVDELIGYLREVNNASVNFDFIYGLPLQTPDSFIDTIEKAIALQPDRLVTFSYAHVPWINKAQLILEKKGLPSAEDKLQMTESAYNLLLNNGYYSIGMDHYVKAEDDLFFAQKQGKLHRNFQGYCTRETTGQVYAFGASGISQLGNVFAQNAKDHSDYISTLNSESFATIKGYKTSESEKHIGDFISHFMCHKGVEWSTIQISIGITTEELKNLLTINTTALDLFQKEGIIEQNEKGIFVTDNGLPFIRNVVATFDPALAGSNKSFSKAV